MNKVIKHMSRINYSLIVIVILMVSLSLNSFAQIKSVGEALNLAIEQNKFLGAAYKEYESVKRLEKSAIDLGKTSLFYSYDKLNLSNAGNTVDVFGANQTISFPSLYGRRKNLLKNQSNLSLNSYQIQEEKLKRDVELSYYNIQYLQNQLLLVSELDSLGKLFISTSDRRYELGEIDLLENASLKTTLQKLRIQRIKTEQDLKSNYQKFWTLLNQKDSLIIQYQSLEKINTTPVQMTDSPIWDYYQTLNNNSEYYRKYLNSDMLPELYFGYFIGFERNDFVESNNRFPGYSVGVNFPLFFNAQNARIQSSKIQMEKTSKLIEAYEETWDKRRERLVSLLEKQDRITAFFETEGLANSTQLRQAANSSYSSGDYDVSQLIIAVQNAIEIQLEYLKAIADYNEAAIYLKYIGIESPNNN